MDAKQARELTDKATAPKEEEVLNELRYIYEGIKQIAGSGLSECRLKHLPGKPGDKIPPGLAEVCRRLSEAGYKVSKAQIDNQSFEIVIQW